jgi:hypothetical protein
MTAEPIGHAEWALDLTGQSLAIFTLDHILGIRRPIRDITP